VSIRYCERLAEEGIEPSHSARERRQQRASQTI